MQKITPIKTENLDEVITRRNARLLDFLDVLSVILQKEVRMIGDKNNPAIIVDDNYCLSAFVHNFDLNFTNIPRNGEVIYKVKLEKEPVYDTQLLLNAINNSEHYITKRIRYRGTDLFLTGYNSFDKKDDNTIYPVFSRYRPRIYFSLEKAKTAIEKYGKDYPLQII